MQHTTISPSRVPPPGDPAVRAFYDSQRDDPKWRVESAEEQAVIAHLRGWCHSSHLCPLCAVPS